MLEKITHFFTKTLDKC